MIEERHEARRGQGGFALILAILSLLVLTFLGLTLAATTSTELQIANNYRWGLEAAANAEAGIEVAKVYLRAVPNDWSLILPGVHPGGVQWAPNAGAPQPPLPPAYPTMAGMRDWENSGCDEYGGHAGYGLVLTRNVPGVPALAGPQYLQDVTNVLGYNLNGSFTVWIRRAVSQSQTGQIGDVTTHDVAILTSEGVAPRSGLRNSARRVIELKVAGASFDCQSSTAMNGAGQGGAGFASCRSLGSGCAATAQITGTFGAGRRSTDAANAYSTQGVGDLCGTSAN